MSEHLMKYHKENLDNVQKIQVKGSSTPILDNFSRDLTMLASLDELDPVIGRKKEIRRIAQTSI